MWNVRPIGGRPAVIAPELREMVVEECDADAIGRSMSLFVFSSSWQLFLIYMLTYSNGRIPRQLYRPYSCQLGEALHASRSCWRLAMAAGVV